MIPPSPFFSDLVAKRAGRGVKPWIGALAALALSATLPATAMAKDKAKTAAQRRAAPIRPIVESWLRTPDSDRAQVGLASIYSRKLGGRRMANGAPLRLDQHVAASTTLPLGSTAIVTNLANGERATVTITDRGPFVRGRIIDLTPHTAMQLGIGSLGKVEVARIAPPKEARDSGDLVLAGAAAEADWPPR